MSTPDPTERWREPEAEVEPRAEHATGVPLESLLGLRVLSAWSVYDEGAVLHAALMGRVIDPAAQSVLPGSPPGYANSARVVLPMTTAGPVRRGHVVKITARAQQVFRPDRLIISQGAGWVIEDIRIGNRSQFSQAGNVPADLFGGAGGGFGVDPFVSFETATPAMDIVLIARNVDAPSPPRLLVELDGQWYRLAVSRHHSLEAPGEQVSVRAMRVEPGDMTFEHSAPIAAAPPRVLTFHLTADQRHLYATDEATGLVVLLVDAELDGIGVDFAGITPHWLESKRTKRRRQRRQSRAQRKRAKERELAARATVNEIASYAELPPPPPPPPAWSEAQVQTFVDQWQQIIGANHGDHSLVGLAGAPVGDDDIDDDEE